MKYEETLRTFQRSVLVCFLSRFEQMFFHRTMVGCWLAGDYTILLGGSGY